MKKLVSALLAASVVLLILASCGGGDDDENPFGLESQVVVAEAQLPAALAFAPDGRLFYAEKETGNIRIVTAEGTLIEEPFAHVDVQTGLEWGLTGLALDPEFEDNGYVYAFFTQTVEAGPVGGEVTAKPVITRFTDRDNRGVESKVIADDFPETAPTQPGYNTNGRIHFGPDGFLYATIGDYDLRTGKVSQDLTSPLGKLLRIDKEDGSAPPDNPFVDDPDADPRIFAYGFREPFEFAFHPETDQLFGTDNTAVNCEEINLITAGENYSFPDIGEFPFPDCSFGTKTKGIHFLAKPETSPTDFLSLVFVSGMAFVSADDYPVLGAGLLVCESEPATTALRRLTLSGTGNDQVVADDLVVDDCSFDVKVSPDGTIYYSNDTEVRRLVQVETPQPEE